MHKHLLKGLLASALLLQSVSTLAADPQRELRIGYQPNPIQDASIAMMEKWGKANNVKIIKVPNSYGVYVEKMTASLTSNSNQYDVIWHNDDWGQLWHTCSSQPTMSRTWTRLISQPWKVSSLTMPPDKIPLSHWGIRLACFTTAAI